MNETTAIDLHLNLLAPVRGIQYKSSLIALLDDARAVAERDENGVVRPGCQSISWLGATAYLILLDQIGKCFRPKGVVATVRNPVITALKAFSSVQDQPTLDVVYALRNALAHDYSLFARNTQVTSLQHAFMFRADPGGRLVEFPKVPWNGRYDVTNVPDADQATIVNLRTLGDVVEGVVAKLRELHAAGDLAILPPLTLDEFHIRYGVYYKIS